MISNMSRIVYVIRLGLIFCIIHGNISFANHEALQDALIRRLDFLDCIDDQRYIYRDIFSEDQITIDSQDDFIVISLGWNCDPALNARANNIRFFAAPFDWCMTPYSALYRYISSDFNGFFKRENLIGVASEYNSWVLDRPSGMIFNHDFPRNDLETINNNYEFQYLKYSRRIKRLYAEINSGKHVYFIRFLGIGKSQTLELYKLLKNKFPRMPFTLIVIGENPSEFGVNWNIPHIKNYLGTPVWKDLCRDIAAGVLK